MAVKDPEVAALLERARRTYKTFEVAGESLNFGRLTLEDNIQIKEETGFDLFGESLAAGETGAPNVALRLSPQVQLAVLFRSLKRCYPDITRQEVSELSTLMPLNDILRIIVWALTGTEPPPLEEGAPKAE